MSHFRVNGSFISSRTSQSRAHVHLARTSELAPNQPFPRPVVLRACIECAALLTMNDEGRDPGEI